MFILKPCTIKQNMICIIDIDIFIGHKLFITYEIVI